MARVTATEVKVILPSATTLDDPQIEAAIEAATCVVDAVEVSSCGEDLTAACLKQTELYLSAHFAAVTENTLSLTKEKSICGGEATYGFKFSEGVKGTPFGMMANTISSGCLAEFDKQPVSFHFIGCDDSSV